MADNRLDFAFGWRWLLPLQDCKAITFLGFDNAEVDFWKSVLPKSGPSDKYSYSDAYIIDADRHRDHLTAFDGIREGASVICVVGRGKNLKNWRNTLMSNYPMVRRYGLLPSVNPRVVIPLNSPRHTLYALALHRPGRFLARVAIRIAGLLARIGSTALLERRTLLIASPTKMITPYGAIQSNVAAFLKQPAEDYALYLGVEGGNRKTVVLPLENAAPSVIIKIGESPQSRRSLENEAATLRSLKNTSIAKNVPDLLGTEDTEAAYALYQQFKPRKASSKRGHHKSVVDFLYRLSTINRQSRPLSEFLKELDTSRCEPGVDNNSDHIIQAWSRLKILADSGMVVWEHRSHGDFAPWNCSHTDDGIFVFDWEESAECGLALSDIFYFVISPILFLNSGADTDSTLDEIHRITNDVYQDHSLTEMEINTHLACWLLRNIHKAPFYSQLLQALMLKWPQTKD
jgi:hypothetical protein